ncbi:MAG: hypothetical protein V1897_01320 [Pseudomonadota bacterium]
MSASKEAIEKYLNHKERFVIVYQKVRKHLPRVLDSVVNNAIEAALR